MGPIGNALNALLLSGDNLREEFAAKGLTNSECCAGLHTIESSVKVNELVLDVALELGATFDVLQNRAVCHIQGVSRDGGSYTHAALNTMLTLLKQRSQRCQRISWSKP